MAKREIGSIGGGGALGASPGTYLTRKGDSLSQIAQRELGDASRWGEIFDLNKGLLTVNGKVDPNRIGVGLKLLLPSGPAPKKAPAPQASAPPPPPPPPAASQGWAGTKPRASRPAPLEAADREALSKRAAQGEFPNDPTTAALRHKQLMGGVLSLGEQDALLRARQTAVAPPARSAPADEPNFTVPQGATLDSLVASHPYLTADDIRQLNPQLPANGNLTAGQKLNLPEAERVRNVRLPDGTQHKAFLTKTQLQVLQAAHQGPPAPSQQQLEADLGRLKDANEKERTNATLGQKVANFWTRGAYGEAASSRDGLVSSISRLHEALVKHDGGQLTEEHRRLLQKSIQGGFSSISDVKEIRDETVKGTEELAFNIGITLATAGAAGAVVEGAEGVSLALRGLQLAKAAGTGAAVWGAGGAGAKVAMGAALEGKNYTVKAALNDAREGAIQGAVVGGTMGLAKGAFVQKGAQALQGTAERLVGAGRTANALTGATIGAGMGAPAGALNNALLTGTDSETWKKGVGAGLKTVAGSAASGAGSGAVFGAGMGAIGGAAMKLPEKAPEPIKPPEPPKPVEPLAATVPLGSALKVGGVVDCNIIGTVSPGSKIEAINLSTAPGGRLHIDDTTEVATADANGHFSAKISDAEEGDVIRMRARTPDGKAGEWVTYKVEGMGAHTRPAVVAMQRVVFESRGNGELGMISLDHRPVSEPGARIQFTNQHSGERTVAVLDENGLFPHEFQLKGNPGDEFSIAATDGVHNTDLKAIAGTVSVPKGTSGPQHYPMPKPDTDHVGPDGKPLHDVKMFTGQVFGELNAAKVEQGAIGDCFYPAGQSAIAHITPEAIRAHVQEGVTSHRIVGEVALKFGVRPHDMVSTWGSGAGVTEARDAAIYLMRQQGATPAEIAETLSIKASEVEPRAAAVEAKRTSDPAFREKLEEVKGALSRQAYTVLFYKREGSGYVKVPIVVDNNFYVRPSGQALYGGQLGGRASNMDIWFPLSEKAYAQFVGTEGYAGIGKGGVVSDVFEAVLGRPGRTLNTNRTSADKVWGTIKDSIEAKRPVAAGTYGTDKADLYSNTGIYANHAYSIYGYVEQGGERFVELRNPWGQSVPHTPGYKDGRFLLKLEDFMKLYQNVHYVD